MRPIKLALATDTVAVIEESDKPNEGVKPGEQVVIEGQNQLRPGAKVMTGGDQRGSGSGSGPGSRPGRPSKGRGSGAGPTASTGP